ncbi:MAG: tetratricopeptide repeat protein [Treponema sp.]|nr:tetratricopeptide repeat protein [Treponema sp.]
MRLTHLPLIVAFAMLLSGCSSGPEEIRADTTPAEIVQRAQEASDRNRYKQAKAYYEMVLERFPDDIDMVCTAEYEIAFIHYKQRKYDLAREGFNALLERYNIPDEVLLPPQYKRLATIVLERMAEKDK